MVCGLPSDDILERSDICEKIVGFLMRSEELIDSLDACERDVREESFQMIACDLCDFLPCCEDIALCDGRSDVVLEELDHVRHEVVLSEVHEVFEHVEDFYLHFDLRRVA